MNPTPEALILAIRAHGCDAITLRDAVHEALHALEAELPRGRWDRQSIHVAVKRMGVIKAAASEIMARAVEQIVCTRLGVRTQSVELWALTSCMEACTFGEPFFPCDAAVKAIDAMMSTRRAASWADRIIALAVPKRAKKISPGRSVTHRTDATP